MFVVHGAACRPTERYPTCTYTQGRMPAGKMYLLDIKTILGSDFRVCACCCPSGAVDKEQIPLLAAGGASPTGLLGKGCW